MLDESLRNFFPSLLVAFVFVSLLLLAAAEVGFRIGERLYRNKDEPRKGQIGGVQGAILGLLALLLGFTFALAEQRFEMRRGLVIQEANAIGTTYLRASFLPEAHKQAVESLLRRYVDARIDFYRAGEIVAERAAAEQTAAEIQSKLWAQTIAAAKESPSPILVTFINTLNETIDLDATRLYALRSRVPLAVWQLVLAVAIGGTYITGYGSGASSERNSFSNFLLPLMIALSITLIADLDRTYKGLIRIDEQPLLNLKAMFQSNKP